MIHSEINNIIRVSRVPEGTAEAAFQLYRPAFCRSLYVKTDWLQRNNFHESVFRFRVWLYHAFHHGEAVRPVVKHHKYRE